MDHFKKYNERKAEIERDRLRAFSSVSYTVNVYGYKCRPLSARAWIDLRLVNNGILSGHPSQIAICQYLFRVHEGYPLSGWEKFKIERRIAWGCKKNIVGILTEVYDHMQSAFAEMPEGIASGTSTKSNKIENVEGVVSSIDEIAARYGQHPDLIAEMPLSKIFSLQKASRVATIPGYKVAEPKELQNLKSAHLEQKQKELSNG